MSRIRSIHPGLWTDDAFMALSPLARLLYIGLWTEAFDDGVFMWKPQTIKAKIFPGDGQIDVLALLQELVEADCIAEREDPKHYGLIRNFRTYQRPKKPNSSELLRDDDREYVGLVPNQSGTSPELPPQMEDVGCRMEEEIQTPPPVLDPARALFDQVWEVFPRHPTSSEAAARQVFEAIGAEAQDRLPAAAGAYRTWFHADNKERGRSDSAGVRYAPHLSKWIESGQWVAFERSPSPELVVVQRGDPDFVAVERLRGKPLFVGDSGRTTVTKAELEQARQAHAA